MTEERLTGYYSALDAMERWDEYYNHERPNSAIKDEEDAYQNGKKISSYQTQL